LFREIDYGRGIVDWGKSMMLKRNFPYGEGHVAMRAMLSAIARM
jgi:L-ribulose-5-phosphate 3-epimerase UlaE